jgi:hypothetical protein
MNAQRIIDMPLEEKRRIRADAVAKGICINCLSNPATVGPRGGQRLCTPCRERASEVGKRKYQRHYEDVRYKQNLEAREAAIEGKCNNCRKPVAPREDGKILRYCAKCRVAMRERKAKSDRRGRYKARRAAIEMYGGKCHDCRSTDSRCFEFHHVLNNGKDEARDGRAGRLVRRLVKDGYDPTIVMICANCHRIRHWEDIYG